MNSKDPLDPSKPEFEEIRFSSQEPTSPIEPIYEELPDEDVLAAFELLTARDASISAGESSLGVSNTPIKGDPSELVFTPIRAMESDDELEQEPSEDLDAVLDIISKSDSVSIPLSGASFQSFRSTGSTRASSPSTSGAPVKATKPDAALGSDNRSLEIVSGAIVGVGVDVVDVARFRLILSRRPGFIKRYFTDGEQAEVASVQDPAQRLAARFAVKEAVMKALGVGLGAFALRDVDLIRTDRTRLGSIGSKLAAPTLSLSGSAEDLAKRLGVSHWHVSLTHTASMAMAVVVAQGGVSQPWSGGPVSSSTSATPVWHASSAPCEST